MDPTMTKYAVKIGDQYVASSAPNVVELTHDWTQAVLFNHDLDAYEWQRNILPPVPGMGPHLVRLEVSVYLEVSAHLEAEYDVPTIPYHR